MGGRTSKPKGSSYDKTLAALEAKLAKASDAKAFADLATEFHMVGYRLGHDVAAIIANPAVVDRASAGKLAAHERASDEYARAGNVKRTMFHLVEALDMGLERTDRDRLAARVAALLDTHAPPAAEQLRTMLAKLPADDDEAREQFSIERIKYAFDWERLPGK